MLEGIRTEQIESFVMTQDGSAPAAPAAEGGQPQDPMGGMAIMILPIIILVVFMLFARRSQKRQQDELRKTVENLKPGARVMLNSGLLGRVDKVDKDNQEVRLLIDEDKKVHALFNWAAVARVLDEKVATAKDAAAA